MLGTAPAQRACELRFRTKESGDGSCDVGVRVVKCDGLRAVGVGADDAGREDVEGLAKQDVVGRGADDMELEVYHDRAESNWDIPRETEGPIDFAVCALHLQRDARVVRET